MKLSNPILIRFAALLLSGCVRLWLGTLKIVSVMDPATDAPRSGPRYVYLFWHEMMLLPAYLHVRRGVSTLVSRHRDGELIAQVIRMLGGRSIRGSTNRGGVAALRNLIRQGRMSHLAITPDGPRGPRRVVHTGAVYLASRTAMPVVPLGYAFGRCWRAKSWDRMALPKPFQRACCVSGKPIVVPPDISRKELASFRRKIQAAMDDVQAQAERLAAGRP